MSCMNGPRHCNEQKYETVNAKSIKTVDFHETERMNGSTSLFEANAIKNHAPTRCKYDKIQQMIAMIRTRLAATDGAL